MNTKQFELHVVKCLTVVSLTQVINEITTELLIQSGEDETMKMKILGVKDEIQLICKTWLKF